jgi:2',3'-cyclic-nucleotide 2'-phosphodiesterase
VTNLLFVADVIGSPGRDVLRGLLPELRRRHDVHLVICNCENSAAGFGVTREVARELFESGCDVLTGGNHLWDKKESLDYVAEEPRLVRPANLPAGTPGEGWRVFKAANGTPVGVVNLLGRVFMKEAEDPFRTADAALAALKGQCRIVFVDFHAETTAEKVALGWHLDGRASAVVGTHTHVQTADDRILPKGTAYLTDVGMTGPHDSVIGVEVEAALGRFLNGMPARFETATGNPRLNGVIIEADEQSGLAAEIERISYSLNELEDLARGAGPETRV